MLDIWQDIYGHLNPVAISLGSISIYWYSIMYITGLIVALMYAKWIIKKDNINIKEELIDSYFIWIEIGILLGARIWYILFYDTNTEYYMLHPWHIFNPFDIDGNFVGIRGMSFHGAFVGGVIASLLFARKNPNVIHKLGDVVALSVPVGFVFGRIGNFLNLELIGRETDMPWGIYIDGVLRHPSQLYESFLEGVVIAIIIYVYRKHKKFDGALIGIYCALYAFFRFLAEFWREPDVQLGFLYKDWITMGQIQSLGMIILAIVMYYSLYLYSQNQTKIQDKLELKKNKIKKKKK